MRIYFIYIFCLVNALMMATGTAATRSETAERMLKPRIVGGNNAPSGAFKWMVALYLGEDFQCSATLISDRLVLTAAHCINETNSEEYRGYAGHVRKSAKEAMLEFQSIHVHPDYTWSGHPVPLPSSDVAMLVTRYPVPDYGEVEPLCLSGGGRPERHRHVMAMGWGSITNVGPRVYPDTLQFTWLKVVSNAVCSVIVGDIGNSRLCTTAFTGGICTGDSGGPLVFNDKRTGRPIQVGVASFVTAPDFFKKGANRCGRLAVYERVSDYLPFLHDLAASYNSLLCIEK